MNETWNKSLVNHADDGDIYFRLQDFLSQPHQVLAVFLSLAAILLNVLSLLAICKIQHRITTHFLFIISLALSDITIGVSVLLYLVNKVIHQSYLPGQGPWNERLTSRCMFIFIKSLNSTGLNISLLNLIGMATDHFIAITKPLHYQAIMTKYRISVAIVLFWAVAIVCGFSDFFSALRFLPFKSGEFNYCEVVWMTRYQEEYVAFVLAFLCLGAMSVMYKLIYNTVKSRERPSHQGATETNKRDRKALITTLFIVGTFILCWLPMCLFQIILIAIVKLSPGTLNSIRDSLKHADQFLFDLLLLNCICDPIVYAVRMTEIRLGYKRLCCRKRQASRSDSVSQYTRASLLRGPEKNTDLIKTETPHSARIMKTPNAESRV